MKRGILLKAVLSVATVMLIANGLWAQIPADYQAISGDQAVEIDSVTTGTTTSYYVEPDSYYHPNYAGTGALTAGFVWNWAIVPVGPALSATDNYVEITWGAAGLFNVTVNEEAPAAYGGCTSADTNMYVRVIAEPTVTYSADNPGSVIGASLEVCEGDARLADLVQASFTGISSYQLQWTLQITTLQADHVTIDKYWDADKVDLGGAGFAIDRDGAAGTQDASITAATLDLDKPNDGVYDAIVDGGNKRATVYTYVINGVNDRISRKSDYLSNSGAAATGWTWYDTGAETIAITVNPAPVTGPIYHIPNDWSN
jgi:hypothetical protein